MENIIKQLITGIRQNPDENSAHTLLPHPKGASEMLCVSLIPLMSPKTPPAELPPFRTEFRTVPENIASIIDHTLLKPEATPEQVRRLCQEARTFGFASVCVNPAYVSLSAEQLAGTDIPVCTVVGFPLGNTTTAMKILETQLAIENGAREIDMVLHVGQLKAKNFEYVENDVRAVVKAADRLARVKVILETCLLSNEEVVKACTLVKQAGAHFVKTSTGFNKAGATEEHVRLMRETVGRALGVKAAGGIRDYKTAVRMVKAGASRIGASASVSIMEQAEV